MEPVARQQLDMQRWDVVKRWPELRGEAKLAWLFLWGLANGRPRTIEVHVNSIAADQGSSDSRTGSNHLRRLQERGLVDLPPSKVKVLSGVVSVYLNDPIEIAKKRLGRIEPDPQGVFSFEENPEGGVFLHSGAQGLAHDVASPISPKCLNSAPEFLVSDIDIDIGDATSCARPCAPSPQLERPSIKTPGPRLIRPEDDLGPEPQRVASAIAEFSSVFERNAVMGFDVKEKKAKVHATRIRELAGPRLWQSIVDSIARDVAFGVFPEPVFAKMLANVAEFRARLVNKDGTQQTPENWSSYFHGAAKRAYLDLGIPWGKKSPGDADSAPGANG
jgi:hypothetical protein